MTYHIRKLAVALSIYLFIYSFIYLSIHLFIYLFIYLFIILLLLLSFFTCLCLFAQTYSKLACYCEDILLDVSVLASVSVF